jgi:hypothetical protein
MSVRESARPNRVPTRAGPIASDLRHFIAAYLPLPRSRLELCLQFHTIGSSCRQ